MTNKTIEKRLHQLRKGDKVKMRNLQNKQVILTVKAIDLLDRSFTTEESVFDFYREKVRVLVSEK